MKRDERVCQILQNVLRFNIWSSGEEKVSQRHYYHASDLYTVLSPPDLYIQVPAHSQTRLKLDVVVVAEESLSMKSLYLWLGLCVVNF